MSEKEDGPMTDRNASLTAIFSEHLNIEVPSQNTDLFEEGLLDSLAFIDLLMHLEKEFGLEVAPDELELDNFRTISCISKFVDSRSGTAQ